MSELLAFFSPLFFPNWNFTISWIPPVLLQCRGVGETDSDIQRAYDWTDALRMCPHGILGIPFALAGEGLEVGNL